MNVVEFADKYVSERGLAKTPVYSAQRFITLVGDIDIKAITADHLKQFTAACAKRGLSAWTIRGGLKDLRTLIRASGGDVKIDSVSVPDPEPEPTPLEHIDAVWKHLPAWGKQFTAVSYWTCLRLADCIKLQPHLHPEMNVIQATASKTGRTHRLPVPKWLKVWLAPCDLPYTASASWNAERVRDMLAAASKAAEVPTIKPSHLRDAGLGAWHRSSIEVGKVVHGCGLSGVTMRHYVDQLSVIQPAAVRVPVPSCFRNGDDPDPTEDLISLVRVLDPEGQQMLLDLATRLAK